MNNLYGMRTYLVGAMDRVIDGGRGWRNEITPILESMNVSVLNPCDHPVKAVDEDDSVRKKIEEYKNNEHYHKIKEQYGKIRNADLRCVDISDFLVCQIDMDIHMCGSYEEIVTANRQKKPILVWCKQGKQKAPNWLFFMIPHEHIFSNLKELIFYLEAIDSKPQDENLSRWFFLKKHTL